MKGYGDKPKPPFPAQTQETPGLESEMTPTPQYKNEGYKPGGKLEGKVALITGGDSGIGRAVAYLYAREGADVAITHHPDEQSDADSIKKEIEGFGRTCLTFSGSVGERAFCEEAVESTVKDLGKLDILVNNAAMMLPCSIENFTDEILEEHYRVNVFAYYYTSQAALKHMSEGAVIINTGSIVGSRGGGSVVYSATKGANHAFTKTLARELLSRGIRVNCVAPGPVWTPLQPVYHSENDIQHFGSGNPAERPAQPEELAPAYVYLASNADSSYMTGEIIFVTGGDTAR